MKRFTSKERATALKMAHVVDSDSLVIMSYNIHNPDVQSKVPFTMELWNGEDYLVTIINTEIEPKDTLFFDTKIILIKGDYIKVNYSKELHIIISGA